MTVHEGREDEFVEQFQAQAVPIFSAADGFVSVELHRCIERPAVFVMRVAWESLEAHVDGFRGSPLFPKWRAFAEPFWAAAPTVEHFAPQLG